MNEVSSIYTFFALDNVIIYLLGIIHIRNGLFDYEMFFFSRNLKLKFIRV